MRNAMLANSEWDWLPRGWGWPQMVLEQVPQLNRTFAKDNAHLLPVPSDLATSTPSEDEDVCVWSHSGAWQHAHQAFGFDAPRLHKLVSKRVLEFQSYKRRDESYSRDTKVRADLGQTVLKKRRVHSSL